MTKPPRAFLSLTEVARRLGVSRRTIYHWDERGVLPAIDIAGTRKIPAAAFDKWLDECEDRALAAVRRDPSAPIRYTPRQDWQR